MSYLISVALALCEGRILGVGRVWADGEEISPDDLNMHVYCGDAVQLPDPVIAAHEGEEAPAYRDLAYVVLENLSLERWGNRMPQLQFEVTRPAQDGTGLCADVEAVAVIPGTGEYSLATTSVTHDFGLGETVAVNRTTPLAKSDFTASMRVLGRELPRAESVSLVVSWFGDDLRIGHCSVQPKVEAKDKEGAEMSWRAGGIGRADAVEVSRKDDRPIYGGTPADQSVIEAIRATAQAGRNTMFYPFILMEQLAGNGLPDPYGGVEQPVLPWRGRITTNIAPGQPASNDGTASARAEVAQFFGTASVSDFEVSGDTVSYSGTDEWSYRRFILHYAHLCVAAGGVDAFLIGSEMVGMTQIRDENGDYPAVTALCRLAGDCRRILGPRVKIGYAADWSEYFGHRPGNGDVLFHLDPLWADQNIDFIGIDNYMPLSDWRDGETHLDAAWGRIDNPKYLLSNVAGGEGFDWYYASDKDRIAQRRRPISDDQHGEEWVWRYKDIRGWWENAHHERVGGVRKSRSTPWIPGSKPIWFTEYGCAALNKATNQPNKFLDALSSESVLPWFSDGRRDDAVQAAYIRAINAHWNNPANNPEMVGGGRMVDMTRAHVWCWDARPFPAFPGRSDLWSDGPAWERGHWLNGRAGAVALSAVVRDICRDAGVTDVDADELSGVVRGFALLGGETGRASLQSLMLAYGFDGVERDGRLCFVMRDGLPRLTLSENCLAISDDVSGVEMMRTPEVEITGRLRLSHVEASGDYAVTTAETMLPDADLSSVSETEFPLALTRAEGQAICERWLAEALTARNHARFALPPSFGHLRPCDIVNWSDGIGADLRWRIERIERAGALTIDAVKVDASVYRPGAVVTDRVPSTPYRSPLPMWPMIMDLPLIRGDERPHAPYIAVTATPWKHSASVYISDRENGGFEMDQTVISKSIVGTTINALGAARPGLLDRGQPLLVRLKGGAFNSASLQGVLAGANVIAIGDGTAGNWEVVQFCTAELASPGEWAISDRLRGQAGTDGLMPKVWPKGSVVVLLDGAPRQSTMPPAARGQMRHWRVGPATLAPDDASYRSLSAIVRGAGLRPYAPCHLRLQDGRLTWVRRTRVDGDGWEGFDVPLGEARELYHVRLMQADVTIHDSIVERPYLKLPEVNSRNGRLTAEVAQVSDQYGPGPYSRREFDVYE